MGRLDDAIAKLRENQPPTEEAAAARKRSQIALVELVDDFIARVDPASAGRFPRSRARGWDLLISRAEPYGALRLRTDGRIWVSGSRNDWVAAREFDRTFTDGELDELAGSMASVLIRSGG